MDRGKGTSCIASDHADHRPSTRVKEDGPDTMKGIAFQDFRTRGKGCPLDLHQTPLLRLLILTSTQQCTQTRKIDTRMNYKGDDHLRVRNSNPLLCRIMSNLFCLYLLRVDASRQSLLPVLL